MTKLKELQTRLTAHPEVVSALIYLGVCIAAFGVFIPVLGFYWDDWPTIFYTHSGRISQLINHFSYDRPFSVWAYYLVGRLGTAPIVWHMAALLLRWALVVVLAWALKPLWPKQTKQIFYIGLIFAIYPGYYVQPLSVIFVAHLTAYIAFFISLGAMGRAISNETKRRQYTWFAVAAAIVQMFTLEYYVGLELVRPVYIWMQMRNQHPKAKLQLKLILHDWAPYFAVFVAWIVWRLFLLRLPSEPYPLAISHNPFIAAMELVRVGIQDLIYIVFATWINTVRPAFFISATRVDWIAWGVAGASAIGLGVLLLGKQQKKEKNFGDRQFSKQGIFLGLFAFFSGMGPIWVIGETIAQGDYNQRYILVAMFGASMFLIGLISYLIPIERSRILLIVILVGLAIGNHIRRTDEFHQDWERQRNFYWQLFWRAPAIQSNTALISFDRLTHWTGEPLLGNALNTLYPPHAEPPAVDLWDFELTRTKTVMRIQNGELLTNDYRGLTFSMGAAEDLFLYFAPTDGCLWVLNPIDVNNEYLPVENREIVSFSNTANILPESLEAVDTTVFGSEPEHDWCYTFEKAESASQQGDWEAVIDLMETAQEKGLQPNIGIEWLPLVKAYEMSGDWAKAQELSLTIHNMQTKNDSMICATWEQVLAESGDGPGLEAFEAVRGFAGCK